MNDILHFYLETVLPSAFSGHTSKKNYQTQIDKIGNVFKELKRELVKCVSISADFVCLPLRFRSIHTAARGVMGMRSSARAKKRKEKEKEQKEHSVHPNTSSFPPL